MEHLSDLFLIGGAIAVGLHQESVQLFGNALEIREAGIGSQLVLQGFKDLVQLLVPAVGGKAESQQDVLKVFPVFLHQLFCFRCCGNRRQLHSILWSVIPVCGLPWF